MKNKTENSIEKHQTKLSESGNTEAILKADLSQNEESDFIVGEESEPYLGPSWTILMLVLYVLKTLFPAAEYSPLWWLQLYILLIVMGITAFTLIKRYRYSRLNHSEKEFPVKDLPES
ncbi:MAG TPA: hypothetical protein PKA63_11015 [Oligoflexia bacterium]|nr:hypothetical protein [Oligoflexia bacterium]HMP49188.1 hypothetical protein [Oligoflexia bacterium]